MTDRDVCIVGVGETRYTRWGGIKDASEHRLALEAILAAVGDAGLAVDEVDGLVSFAGDRNDALALATDLGVRELRFANMVWLLGGGGACAAVGNAAMAVQTGLAEVVVVYRALCQGQFRRFGGSSAGTSAAKPAPRERPAPRLRTASSIHEAQAAFSAPFGAFSPAVSSALVVRRHMELYGTTAQQLAHVATTFRSHASYNPRAVMGDRPMTLEDYHASRMVADPLRLFDCCLETDGACAVVVTSADRARDLAKGGVDILGHAQGAEQGYSYGIFGNVNMPDELYASAGAAGVARRLWSSAGLGPEDVDVAQLYDHFSGMMLLTLEDFGLCGRGESGPFVESGALSWEGGSLPTNTHGGSLSEAYVHGLNHVVEGVRQLRDESTCPVSGAEVSLVTSAAGVPTSAVLLGRQR